MNRQTHYFDIMKTSSHPAFSMKGKPGSLKTRAAKITRTLKAIYPHVKTQLDFRNPFELLVSTILSAQCTDKQVNRVAETLFKKLKHPRDFDQAPIEVIEELIRPTGYFHNKAKNLK
ncbi:MAG: endonuclease III, partial [Thermodesulfobacteriota bacterium]